MNPLFDQVPDRRGTMSYKWQSADPEVLPLWVADMDFRTAPAIVEALHRRVDHGVFGYTAVGDDYYQAIDSWYSSRYGINIDRNHVIYTTGVVPAISAIIKALTRPGDAVLVLTPVYNCFFSSIRNNGCRIEAVPLKRRTLDQVLFTYDIDFDAMELACMRDDVKMLLLCNPHNPVGRVWTADELQRIADICRRNGVIVVSDEIHCDLTMPGYKFTSYLSIDAAGGIVCSSPSKAFNIAGLHIANIMVANEDHRRAIDRAINDNEVCDVNSFGPVALIAAYTYGNEWLTELVSYINSNYHLLSDFMVAELPMLSMTSLQATYLAWLDITPLGRDADTLEEELLNSQKLWLNSGGMYGDSHYIRINLACPAERLQQALRRLKAFVQSVNQ